SPSTRRRSRTARSWSTRHSSSRSRSGSRPVSELETLLTGYGLIEAPVWDGTGLVFSDVSNGGLHLLGPDGEVTTVVAHRRGIGGAAPHADGGYVISGRNVAWKSGDATSVLFAGDPANPPKGFND